MDGDSAKPIVSEAIVATDLTKWFGEGETKTTAVNGAGLVAHFGENAVYRRTLRQRQNHDAEHDLQDPAAQRRQGNGQGAGYLNSHRQ